MSHTLENLLTAIKDGDNNALRKMGAARIGDGGFTTRHVVEVIDSRKDNSEAEWLKLRLRLESIEDCAALALCLTYKIHGSGAKTSGVLPTERTDPMLLRDCLLELSMLVTGRSHD